MDKKRNLWQCGEAIVGPRAEGYTARVHKLVCLKGHTVRATTYDMEKGKPLESKACQTCPDYNENGPPLPVNLRGGWRVG